MLCAEYMQYLSLSPLRNDWVRLISSTLCRVGKLTAFPVHENLVAHPLGELMTLHPDGLT